MKTYFEQIQKFLKNNSKVLEQQKSSQSINLIILIKFKDFAVNRDLNNNNLEMSFPQKPKKAK